MSFQHHLANRGALIAAALALFGTAAQATPAFEDCLISDTAGIRTHAARCTRVEQPENPAAPDGPQVALFVAVIPALTPNPADDALTVIAGGPGAASTQFYASYAGAFEAIRRERDIVLVDQRGTGQSNPLNCKRTWSLIETSEATDLDDDTLRALTRQCLEELDHDPRFYTTSVAVGDLDAVREALGYSALNLYGASYGTRVALHYLRRFPEHTRTLIIDGVVPAQIPIATEIALDAQAALRAIFARCAEEAACHERFPTLQAQFDSLLTRLTDGPIEIALADPTTGAPDTLSLGLAHLQAVTRLLSYSPTSVSVLPLLIEQAAQGNYGPLAAQALLAISSLDDALSYGMHNAVACTEDAPYFDDFIRDSLDAQAIADSYLGARQHESLAATCSVWPIGLMDEDFKTPVVSDRPVLVLSGEADPVTPPRNGERAIGDAGAYLSNAQHLIAPGQGHGIAIHGCLPQLIGEFVEAASHAELDATCLQRLQPNAFFLDFSATAP